MRLTLPFKNNHLFIIRRLTPESRDRAICHALVAALISSGDFQVELQAFASTFRKKPEE